MVALRLDIEGLPPERFEAPEGPGGPVRAAPTPTPKVERDAVEPPRARRLGFEAKAQDLLPIRDLPKTPSALGRWWGRVVRGPVVKATLLGASSFLLTFGAPLASPRRANAAPSAAKKREVVFLGFNPGAKHEATKLGEWAPEGVAFVGPARLQDRALVDGRLVDLSGEGGRAAFAERLDLPAEARAKLVHALEITDAGGRDEVARLARLFAEAERGDRVIERLVLSGHSLGAGLWGDDNGEMSWKALEALTQAFPKAARQVEDVLVAACYAGGRTQMNRFRAMFPRVKSLWGYAGSAPGAYSGSVWHMKRWERQTRGPGDDRLDRSEVAHLRKGDNVAIWTRGRGFDDGRTKRPLSQLRDDYARTRDLVPLFLSGAQQVRDPGRGPLREHYGNLQALLQRPELPEAERPPLEAEREMVIRLLYYGRVARYFEEAHAPALDRAYEALDRDRPDFSRLSREDALAEILALERAAAASDRPEVAHAARLLTEGLRDLEPERIPSAWL